jgi:hypothetical protein
LQANKYISRLVRVGATNPPSIFTRAISTSGPIKLSGSKTVVDSYDSAFGTYSTTSNRTANGGIASASTAAGAISLGSAHVYGTGETGPGGTITPGSGALGDVAWNATHTGIQPGSTNNDMNVAFPSNTLPAGVSFPLTSSTLTTYANTTNSFSGGWALPKAVYITGNVMLYIPGNITINAGGFIQINPGASLTIYCSGNTVKITGGGVVNLNGNPSSFTYVGLAGNKNVTIGGGGTFYGTINAPQADLSISGNGDFFGAAIGKTYTASGGGNFHYDGQLAKAGDMYVVSWKEL